MKALKIIYLILLCIFLPTLPVNKKNKIIFQISPARCLATASFRMWEARGDFRVMNEPMMYAYVIAHTKPHLAQQQSEIPTTYDQFIRQIIGIAETNNIFVKEESTVFIECLQQNPSILKDDRVHIVIMLRNPHHSVISFYNRHKKIINDFAFLLGYQSCYDVLQMALEHCVNPPILLYAESLSNTPYKTAQLLCSLLDIPFLEHMLHWESLGDNFDGRKWFDLKDKETLYHWHSDAIKSTSFHKPTSYEVDTQGNPTFSEISNTHDKDECIKAYHFNKFFYDRINSHLPNTQQYASSRSSVT